MDILALHAGNHPDKPALIQGERVWSWAGYVERRNRLAHGLVDLGIAPGQHVIIYTENSLEHVLASAAARAVGAIPAPMNHRLVAEEVAYILDHSDAVAVFVGNHFLPVAEVVRSQARKVRQWILVGSERRPWARHLDDLVAGGASTPVTVEAGKLFSPPSAIPAAPRGSPRALSAARPTCRG